MNDLLPMCSRCDGTQWVRGPNATLCECAEISQPSLLTDHDCRDLVDRMRRAMDDDLDEVSE